MSCRIYTNRLTDPAHVCELYTYLLLIGPAYIMLDLYLTNKALYYSSAISIHNYSKNTISIAIHIENPIYKPTSIIRKFKKYLLESQMPV